MTILALIRQRRVEAPAEPFWLETDDLAAPEEHAVPDGASLA